MGKDNDSDVNKQVAGSLKEAIGKITGDTDVQAEGLAEKKAGEPQSKDPTTKPDRK